MRPSSVSRSPRGPNLPLRSPFQIPSKDVPTGTSLHLMNLPSPRVPPILMRSMVMVMVISTAAVVDSRRSWVRVHCTGHSGRRLPGCPRPPRAPASRLALFGLWNFEVLSDALLHGRPTTRLRKSRSCAVGRPCQSARSRRAPVSRAPSRRTSRSGRTGYCHVPKRVGGGSITMECWAMRARAIFDGTVLPLSQREMAAGIRYQGLAPAPAPGTPPRVDRSVSPCPRG